MDFLEGNIAICPNAFDLSISRYSVSLLDGFL